MARRLLLTALSTLLLMAVPAWGQAPTPATAPAAVAAPAEPLRTAGERPVDVRHIRLDLRVDLKGKAVDGVATLDVRALRQLPVLRLDAVGLKVKEVTATRTGQAAEAVKFHTEDRSLVIELAPAWASGQEGAIRVVYRVQDPREGLHFHGPSAADPQAPLTVWSQGEPVSNRYWFPCLDIPDERQTTEVAATVPAGNEVLSNGKLVEKKDNGDGTVTFHWLQDKPHPSYLVTLVVGKFDVVREEWDGIPVTYYVPAGEKETVGRTFGRTREMLDFFSRKFGVRYPWDKYAQVVAYEFGGGMENTSATTLGDALHDERSFVDGNADGLIAHELAHQWWGDLVTCRDWAHLWLNEGFASYAEAMWDEHAHGREAFLFNMDRKGQGAISGGKERPVVDRRYRDPGSMFDARAYPKGAWVLHMLRRKLGEEAFWRGVRRYAEEHRLKSIETADFRRTLERETGRDLERFFYDWTERPGHPVLEVATTYEAEKKQARVVLKQAQAGEPFHVPVALALTVEGQPKPVVVEELLTGKEATVVVPLAGRLLGVEVDPESAVLAEIKETKERGLWEEQLRRGGPPARLRAAKHFQEGKSNEDRAVLARAFAEEKFWGVKAELASMLGELGGDGARAALVAGLGDPDARVRRASVAQLDKFKDAPDVVQAVRGVLKTGDKGYAVEAAALEAYARMGLKDAVEVVRPWLERPSRRDVLRAAALRSLGAIGDVSALDLLLEWAGPGHPRAARTGALEGLVRLAKKAKLSEEQVKRMRQAMSEALTSDSAALRMGTVAVVADWGPASELRAAVEKVARQDSLERVRRRARDAVERLAKAEPGAEAAKLREEVERLKREQEALREKIERLEKPAARPSAPAAAGARGGS